MDKNRFDVVARIRLGTGIRKPADFLKVIKDAGMFYDDVAGELFGGDNFTFAPQPVTVSLVCPSVRELLLPNRCILADIVKAAKARGLELCPSEVGPQLRLQCFNQSENDWFYIGMDPIKTLSYHYAVFGVGKQENKLWISGLWANPERLWFSHDRFCFMLPHS